MRGRILLVAFMSVAAAALTACGKRDSLYIDPGKEGPPAPAKPAKSPPAKPGAPPSRP